MNNPQNKTLVELKWKLVGIFGSLFLEALFSTTPIESVGFEKISRIFNSRKFIGASWHSRILLISYLHKRMNGAILVSQSDDGEIIARILQQQGHEPIRGSTTRGGLRALAKLIKTLKEKDRPAGMIPDGPQGPRFKVQPGVIILAKKTGYPIIPITYSAKKIKIFSSWDRFIIPFPFTPCKVIYGDPVYVPNNADNAAAEISRIQLENELCRITQEADRSFGHLIL